MSSELRNNSSIEFIEILLKSNIGLHSQSIRLYFRYLVVSGQLGEKSVEWMKLKASFSYCKTLKCFHFFSRTNVFVGSQCYNFEKRPRKAAKTPWKMHNKAKQKKQPYSLATVSRFGMCKAFAIGCKCSITKFLLLCFSFGRPPPKQPSIADTKRIHLNKPFIWLLLNNLILFPSFFGFLVFCRIQLCTSICIRFRLLCVLQCVYADFPLCSAWKIKKKLTNTRIYIEQISGIETLSFIYLSGHCCLLDTLNLRTKPFVCLCYW